MTEHIYLHGIFFVTMEKLHLYTWCFIYKELKGDILERIINFQIICGTVL